VEIKGVAENGAKIIINGLIKIEKEAEKTDSFLSMKVLLMDDKSRAILKPELEIKNGNVKASHSASAGKIDPEQLFYLKSRGIEEKEAKQIIINGFLN
jgi:Fe-S cluster assembly protein SufD